jgi:hypothetical protein
MPVPGSTGPISPESRISFSPVNTRFFSFMDASGIGIMRAEFAYTPKSRMAV